jgi:hypothetical protein
MRAIALADSTVDDAVTRHILSLLAPAARVATAEGGAVNITLSYAVVVVVVQRETSRLSCGGRSPF